MRPSPAGSIERFTHTQTLLPEDHGRFIELPFELPPQVETLVVSCEVVGQEHAGTLVDLGLRDPERIRGWSGGARGGFTIAREHATPGYLPGELLPGRWAVLLASNRIPAEGCTVTLRIECMREQPRWLKGDLHTHTVHSDGSYALPEAIELAEATGLDFIALTDHNTTSQNLAYPRETRIVCIPGMELTTYRGHANLLGVAQPVDDFRVASLDDLQQRLAEAEQRGARRVLCHPFDPGCGWQWDWQIAYDWFEVWNGPWRPSNQQALDWWQAQLVAGQRLVAVGGSDTHRLHPYVKHGWPTTWVYSPARSGPEILAAIGRGHVFLSYAPSGPRIELHCGSAQMGDLVAAELLAASRPPQLQLSVDQLEAGDVVKLIADGGVEEELAIPTGQSTLTLRWPAARRRFYRIEVWRYFPQVDQTLMAALSNPIYLPG